jgi:beta-fructofuranosidase
MTDRQSLSADPHRPAYHFLPPANWMNDPNGLIQWQGQYHLFYQHNPFEPVWGFMHWGHAASPDLVHWRDLPIALSPQPGSPRQDGCWSGCAIEDQGNPTLVYTEVRDKKEWVYLATTPDGMLTWEKDPRNPVNVAPPPGMALTAFRDPYVRRAEDAWQMVIGSGIQDGTGIALRYRSEDLLDWAYLGPLLSDQPAEYGTVWECPNFFPLDGKHVLVVSAMPLWKAVYFTGNFTDGKFIPERRGILDYGERFYAPQIFADERQRSILFGWLWEERSESAQRAAGWAGVMSLPRQLFLGPAGELCAKPLPEIESLRAGAAHFTEISLPTGANHLLPVAGNCLELNAEFKTGPGACGLKLSCSPGMEEQTLLGYDTQTQQLFLDRQASSLSPEVEKGVIQAPLALVEEEDLRLHVFLDRSVIEVFANDRCCLAARIYPTRSDSLQIRLFSSQGIAHLTNLDAWQIQPVWPAQPGAGGG